MCGPVRISTDLTQLKIRSAIAPDRAAAEPRPELERRADRQPAHRALQPKSRAPHARPDALGLSPVLGQGHQDRLLDNAMAETVDTKSVFREAFKQRRCLVPIEAFYEWRKLGPKEKQPYAIALDDRGLMALAGLWETWRSLAQETVRSFTIITTMPNELCAPIHDRMPVILPPETWPEWLGEEVSRRDQSAAARLTASASPAGSGRPVSRPRRVTVHRARQGAGPALTIR
jgi:putative SOS response-associated peptidase YedK